MANFEVNYLAAGIIAALIIVIARFVALYLPSRIFGLRKELDIKTLIIMTWGGLRGGISIALALSLPASEYKNIIVSVTFVIVLFSILAQGLSIGKVIRKLSR